MITPRLLEELALRFQTHTGDRSTQLWFRLVAASGEALL
jgi:hypothetical protein